MSRMQDLSDWQTVVQIIGEEEAAALSSEYGGGRMLVPKLLGKHHPITVLIGQDAADRLATGMGGEKIDVPMELGKRAMILQLSRGGMPVPQICRRVGVSRRQVFYVRAAVEADKKAAQPDLFKG